MCVCVKGKALWTRGGPRNSILGTNENLRLDTLLGPPLAFPLQFLPQYTQKNNSAQPRAMQRPLSLSQVILR